MIHALKTDPKYFNEVINGRKSFEIRKNDRDFLEGDYIALNEHNREIDAPAEKQYTGRSALFRITYILDTPELCKDGYVVMGLEKCLVSCWYATKPEALLCGHARGGGAE